MGEEEGSWVPGLGELGGWQCHHCDGNREGTDLGDMLS